MKLRTWATAGEKFTWREEAQKCGRKKREWNRGNCPVHLLQCLSEVGSQQGRKQLHSLGCERVWACARPKKRVRPALRSPSRARVPPLGSCSPVNGFRVDRGQDTTHRTQPCPAPPLSAPWTVPSRYSHTPYYRKYSGPGFKIKAQYALWMELHMRFLKSKRSFWIWSNKLLFHYDRTDQYTWIIYSGH